MILRTLSLAAALGAALAGPAAAESAAEKAAMISAIAAAGCQVTGANNAAILSAAGLSEDAAAAVVQSLLDAGQARIEGGVLVLKTGGCS